MVDVLAEDVEDEDEEVEAAEAAAEVVVEAEPSHHQPSHHLPNKLPHSLTRQSTLTTIACASRVDLTLQIGITVKHALMIGVNKATKKVVTLIIGGNMNNRAIMYPRRQGTRLETCHHSIEGQGKHRVVEH